MGIKIDYSGALEYAGNQTRLKRAFEKAKRGEHLTIGFLGGSITQGAVASTPDLCYAARVFSWWEKTFPQATFTYVNAGIGATDSQFGCARAREDLLSYEPDVISVEFAVNDESNAHYLETFEGLIRQVLAAPGQPAVYVFYNVCYDTGASAQLQHAKVVRHYDVPAFSMRSTILPLLLSGQVDNRVITPDDLHPNDLGHELVASVITHCLEEILNGDASDAEKTEDAKAADGMCSLPAPMTENAYEDSVRFRSANAVILENKGFTVDPAEQAYVADIFKNGWTASEQGSRIVFEVEGSCLGVQYRKTMQLPAPVAKLVIDGDEAHAHLLDANFDETWGDKLVLDTVLNHGENKKHRVAIELVTTHPEDRLPFYLVSVIGSGK